MKKNITNNPTIVIRDDGFSHLFRCEMPCTPKKFGDLFAGYLKGKAHIREIGVGAGFAYTYNTKIGDIMGSDVPIKFIDDSHDGQLSWNLPKEILDLLKKHSDDESIIDKAYKLLNELQPKSLLRWSDLRAIANIHNLIKEGSDPFGVLAEKSHEIGLKVWARFELRKGVPSSLIDKEEIFIKGTTKPTFKSQEVRTHYHNIFKEIISLGADGISLDFCVYPPFVENPREEGVYLTNFLREIRENFPNTEIVTRLPRNPEQYGLYWREWIEENVVDVIIPSVILPGELFDLNVDEYIEAAIGTKCKIFGCMRPKYTNINPDERKKDGNKKPKHRFNRPCTEENDMARASLLLTSGVDSLPIALGTAMSYDENIAYASNAYTDMYKPHYEKLLDYNNIKYTDKTYPLVNGDLFTATLDNNCNVLTIPFRIAEDFQGAKALGIKVCVSICPIMRALRSEEKMIVVLNNKHAIELTNNNLKGDFNEPVNYSHTDVVDADKFEFGWWLKGRKYISISSDYVKNGENILSFIFESSCNSSIDIIDVDVEVKYNSGQGRG